MTTRHSLLSYFVAGIIGSVVLVSGCSEDHKPIEILKRKRLKNIPEASGVIFYENHYFIIGDKLAELYILDSSWGLQKNIKLLPKKESGKTDLESLALYNDTLFAFSSGSKKKGVNALLIYSLRDKKTELLDLSPLMEQLRSQSNTGKVNIEGAAILNNLLYLADRESNRIIVFDRSDVMRLLRKKNNVIQPLFEKEFKLKEIDGLEARFSGLEFSPDGKDLYFTASVENEEKGAHPKIFGSFIGKIGLKKDYPTGKMVLHELPGTHEAMKVESIDFIGKNRIVVVVDNDSKSSHIMRCRIKF